MIDRAQFTRGKGNPDVPVPIGEGATVPTEKMALLLCSLLNTRGNVLEIGTGSGYQTALLAEMCNSVVSVEVTPISDVADLLPENVTLVIGDGMSFDTGEQFDGILVTFAADRVAHTWFTQLKDGGRLVVPIKLGKSCRICVYQKHRNQLFLVEVPAYAPFTERKMVN